jgi:hypothetical protein
MKRLIKKEGNNVSPKMHEEVEKHIEDSNKGKNRSRELYSQQEYITAKRILAEIPVTPTNERIYELVEDIKKGEFKDISTVAQAKKNWSDWVKRTTTILKDRGVIGTQVNNNIE